MQYWSIIFDLFKLLKFKKKISILIVEDTSTDADLLRRYVEKAGKKADVVSTAEEARGALINKQYSIVFIDIRLPLMDGIDLIKFINDNNPKVKNVIIVGEVNDLIALPKGLFVSLIIKPVNLSAIIQTLKVLG